MIKLSADAAPLMNIFLTRLKRIGNFQVESSLFYQISSKMNGGAIYIDATGLFCTLNENAFYECGLKDAMAYGGAFYTKGRNTMISKNQIEYCYGKRSPSFSSHLSFIEADQNLLIFSAPQSYPCFWQTFSMKSINASMKQTNISSCYTKNNFCFGSINTSYHELGYNIFHNCTTRNGAGFLFFSNYGKYENLVFIENTIRAELLSHKMDITLTNCIFTDDTEISTKPIILLNCLYSCNESHVRIHQLANTTQIVFQENDLMIYRPVNKHPYSSNWLEVDIKEIQFN